MATLKIYGDAFQIHYACRVRPNWWRRFWYWALLGWQWTDDGDGPTGDVHIGGRRTTRVEVEQ